MILWLELFSYLLAAVVALALAMTLMALGPKHTLNRLFALYTLIEAISALSGFVLCLVLWSGQGNPDFWNELYALTFSLMAPLLLVFAARYVGYRPTWADRFAALALIAIVGLTMPLFQGQFISHVRFDAGQLLNFDLSAWGLVVASLPTLYFLGALALFWRARRRTREPYLALGVFILVFGFIVGGLLRLSVPLLSFTTISSVLIIGYGLLSRQLLNPLHELATQLERKVAERTEILSRTAASLDQANQHLLRQAQEQNALLAALPDRVFRLSPAGVILAYRSAEAEAAGPGAQSLVGQSVGGLLPPEASQPTLQAIARTQQTGQMQILEFRRDTGAEGRFYELRAVPCGPAEVVAIVRDITDRQAAEAAVRESEEKFRSFVEQSLDGLALVDEAGYIIEWNPARERLTGTPRAQAVGRLFWDLQYEFTAPERRTPERREQYRAILQAALRTGQSPIFDRPLEVASVGPEGQPHYIQEVVFPIPTKQGYRIGSVTRDISEIRKLAVALQASEAQARARAAELAAVLEAVPVPVYIARNEALSEVIGNRAARQLMRVEPEIENLSLTAPEAVEVGIHFERQGVALPAAERPLEVAARGETLENLEVDFVSKRGVLHMLGNAVPLRDAAGRIYGAISAFTDITELKHAEEALRAGEARLRTYIDQSPVAIFVAEPSSRYVDANPAACALTGYSRAELLQLTTLDLEPAGAVGGVVARLQGGGAFSGELPLRRKDGTVISIIRNQVRLPNGNALSFCTDITARKQAEAQVQRLNAELEQRVAVRTAELSARTAELQRAIEAAEAANRAKSAFLAIMGHELRTPLNSIFLAAEMLHDKPVGLEAQKTYTDIILISGRRLLQMVEGVLEYTSADAQLNLAPVQVAGALQDIAVSFNARAARKRQTLTFDVAPDLPPLVADVHRFDPIIRRLLDNAVKFTPEGGRITVTAWREGAALRVAVADTGPGLRPEDLERIFEPFVQLEASHLVHSEGAGLGLTLARRQAEAHGGRLWAESPGEGLGSTFTLELPLARYQGPGERP